MLTSAKNGDGINKLFKILTEKLLSNPKFSGKKGKGLSLDKNNNGQKKKKCC